MIEVFIYHDRCDVCANRAARLAANLLATHVYETQRTRGSTHLCDRLIMSRVFFEKELSIALSKKHTTGDTGGLQANDLRSTPVAKSFLSHVSMQRYVS